MIKAMLLLFLISVSSSMLNAQLSTAETFKPLEPYNFDQVNQYYLVMIPASPSRKDSIILYTGKPDLLKRYQQLWSFDKQAVTYPFACIDGYAVTLMKGSEEQVSFDIRFRCEAFVFESDYWYINPLETHSLMSFMDKAYEKSRAFKSLRKARVALGELRTDERLVYLSPTDWEDHDGYFFFNVPNPNASGKAPYTEWAELVEGIQKEIRKTYPSQSEDISLVRYGYGKNYPDVGFKVHCNKSFYEQFDLYPVSAWGWRSFEPRLRWWVKG